MDNSEIVNTDNLSIESVSNDCSNITSRDIDTAKYQVQLFLVAQAKRELKRVVKLTETLDRLQDKYQEKVMEYIDNHDDESAIVYLPDFIKVITDCLTRSENIIRQITSNDKIFNNLYLTIPTQINNTAESISNNSINLEDARSRNKVREAVSSVLKLLEDRENLQ